MTRQVHELGASESGVIGHITSLKPIRPANAADAPLISTATSCVRVAVEPTNEEWIAACHAQRLLDATALAFS